MTTIDKLNNLFANAEYIQTIKDFDTIESIYAAVVIEIPELTETELITYLNAVSEQMRTGELSAEDLDAVAGGLGWGALGAAIVVAGGVIALVNGCYDAGKNLGNFIGNLCSK